MTDLLKACEHGYWDAHQIWPGPGRCLGGSEPSDADLLSLLQQRFPRMEVIFEGGWDYEVLTQARRAFNNPKPTTEGTR